MSPPVIAIAVLVLAALAYSRLLTWRHARARRRAARAERALVRVEPFALGLLDGDAVLPDPADAAALSELAHQHGAVHHR